MNSTTNIETKPYGDPEDKKAQVERMFDNIASNYDLLNRLLSFGIDIHWRNVLIRRLERQLKSSNNPDFTLLDVATGTGDLPIMIAKKLNKKQNLYIKGVDLSAGMLVHAQAKLDKAATKLPLAGNITLAQADAENLQFADDSFEATSSVFGVRNFGNLERGIAEMYRVTKPQGKIYILEFGLPDNKIIGALYRFYFHKLLPAVGGLISKDFKAYDYLPKSVDTFASKQEFCQLLTRVGYTNVSVKSMSFGITNLYCADKN